MLRFFRRLFLSKTRDDRASDRIHAFLHGNGNVLTTADIDPDGAKKWAIYQSAMRDVKNGDLSSAAEKLETSCIPPSIYKGHYRDLFKIWRKWNRRDFTAGHYGVVVERVGKMIRYDDEMIREMLRYWSVQQRQDLPRDYFDKDRNLKITDVRTLRKSSEATGHKNAAEEAMELEQKILSMKAAIDAKTQRSTTKKT